MKIKYVTLTGADDSISTLELVELSRRFPYVEWAILFSQSKSGVPRYPSLHWVDNLCEVADSNMNLSAHLCGKWVDDVFKFGFTFLNDDDYRKTFKRIQLNMGRDRLSDALKSENLREAVNSIDQPVIFGGDYSVVAASPLFFIVNNCHVLFDSSGGKGIKSASWPTPYSYQGLHKLCGYAGGLGPDNVEEELEKIAEIVDKEAGSDFSIWIDMETKIRSKTKSSDVFDLNKCVEVLEKVYKWVQ